VATTRLVVQLTDTFTDLVPPFGGFLVFISCRGVCVLSPALLEREEGGEEWGIERRRREREGGRGEENLIVKQTVTLPDACVW